MQKKFKFHRKLNPQRNNKLFVLSYYVAIYYNTIYMCECARVRVREGCTAFGMDVFQWMCSNFRWSLRKD